MRRLRGRLGRLGGASAVPPDSAAFPEAASSVAPLSHRSGHSLRPCLGTTIAPRRRATFRQARLLTSERGYTLVELLQVTAILSVVVGGLMALFLQATHAELDMNRRFQAQQTARLAVDKMRREIHCANAIAPVGTSASITVTVPAQCPTAGGTQMNVVYDTELVADGRYRLRRAGVTIADYVRVGNVFTYTAPSTASLGKLHLDLPINIQPPGSGSSWELTTDMVLRNTTRS